MPFSIFKVTRHDHSLPHKQEIHLPGRASFSPRNGLSEGMLYGALLSLKSTSTRSTLPRSVDLLNVTTRQKRKNDSEYHKDWWLNGSTVSVYLTPEKHGQICFAVLFEWIWVESIALDTSKSILLRLSAVTWTMDSSDLNPLAVITLTINVG